MLTKEALLQRAEEILPWLIEVRRDFHRFPEFGFEEFRTRDRIISYLEEMNIPYQVVCGTGVVGLIQGSKAGKTVALRGDMDALPIEEQNDVPYKSQVSGKMHACGHDAHMTVLLGTARLLQERKDDLAGTVKLLFQPAEETDGGAKPMIEAGVLENPKVDAAFGLHVAPHLPVGQVSVKYGQMYAASDTFTISVKGENAHGAYPHEGKDAIVIAAQVINSLQTIVSRNVDPRQSAVVSVGVIQGGTQGNIVADEVQLRGTIRTLERSVREYVRRRVKEIVEYVPRSMGGSGTITLKEGYTSLINDDQMVDLVRKNGERLLGAENVKIAQLPGMGVEDFAFFAEAVPSAFYNLGCGNRAKGYVYAVHHPRFDIDEECLKIGAAMQARVALSFLQPEESL